MTSARSTLVDLNVTPYYHCVTRCVRRTFLFGTDPQTGYEYSHRKSWIVNRIKKLSAIFAVKICAYAVMSNHYHIVLYINEEQANNWTEDEVLTRWEALFPTDAKNLRESSLPLEFIKNKILIIRHRLMNLSWFMRCLNEVIAKRSNKEEGLSGRFWESRFKSQALLDEGAVLAAMAYVDLNPIRAKMAKTPEESEFTSIYERIHALSSHLNKHNKSSSQQTSFSEIAKQCDITIQPSDLMRLSNERGGSVVPKIDFSLSDYLELVDCTGRILREDKKGSIKNELQPILFRLHLTSSGWLNMTSHLEKKFFDAVGNPKNLLNFKSHLKKSPKGFKASKQFYQNIA